MESLIDRSVRFCFPEMLHPVVKEELQKQEKSAEPLRNLAFLAIKSVMTEQMKDDVSTDIMRKLVLREPMNLLDYCTTVLKPTDMFLEEECDAQLDANTAEWQKDPEMIQVMLEQNLDKSKHIQLEILLKPDSCSVFLQQLSQKRALGKGIRNEEFDMHWARVFMREGFLKGISRLNLLVDGKDKMGWRMIVDHMNRFFESFETEPPAEGWEEAIRKKEKLVYFRYGMMSSRDNNVIVTISVVDEYEPEFAHFYYGHFI